MSWVMHRKEFYCNVYGTNKGFFFLCLNSFLTILHIFGFYLTNYNFLVLSVLYTQHKKPLYSFEDNIDYMYDVMWSPVHPAVFAAVDGMGRLDIWNLNKDTEVSRTGSRRYI